MNILPVVIIAAACYTAGYIHGGWTANSNNQLIKYDERTLDRKVPTTKLI